jgi:hypothetical protein
MHMHWELTKRGDLALLLFTEKGMSVGQNLWLKRYKINIKNSNILCIKRNVATLFCSWTRQNHYISQWASDHIHGLDSAALRRPNYHRTNEHRQQTGQAWTRARVRSTIMKHRISLNLERASFFVQLSYAVLCQGFVQWQVDNGRTKRKSNAVTKKLSVTCPDVWVPSFKSVAMRKTFFFTMPFDDMHIKYSDQRCSRWAYDCLSSNGSQHRL